MSFRRSLAVVAGTSLFLGVTGCYSLQPVAQQSIPIGQMLSLDINDAGRTGLAEQIGQNVTVVMGRLVQKDSVGYVLAVAEVETFRGGTQVWSGERIRVNSTYVNRVNEKKFSRAKTVLVVGAAVGLIAILASQGIMGNVTGENGKEPQDTIATHKIPLFTKR